MKIKSDNENDLLWWKKIQKVLSSFFFNRSTLIFLLSLLCNIVLFMIIIAGFLATTDEGKGITENVLYKLNIEPANVLLIKNGILSENIRIPGHVFQGWLANPDYISIDIKNNDFQWLSQQRDKALSQGIWTGSDETVPATIRYGGEIIKADVRLKGNSIRHWGTDAWSLKVKTEGDSRLFGMREFSIQKPITRLYLTEWVFHKLLTYENIPNLQFSYVSVQINGKDMGIYALEEVPEERLLDANGYPDGPIFHINDNMWIIRAAGYFIEDSSNSVPVELYNSKKYNSSGDLEWQARKGLDLFEAFRDETITTTDAFDLRSLTRFMALSDLTGNINGNYGGNLKVYYNPVTSKLELIGNDAKSEVIKNIFYIDDRLFNQRISKDPNLVWLYVHELERISEPEYLDRFFSVIDTDFKHNLSIMYKENPFYHFPREIYYQNQEKIRQTIFPYRCQYSYLENVSIDGVVYIEAGAAQPMPVEILGLRVNGELLPQTGGPNILPGNDFEEVMNYQILSFNLSNGENRVIDTDNLTLECRVYGTTPARSESVIGKARLSEWSLKEDIVRRQPNPEQFSWLNRDDRNHTFTVQPGIWEINKDLIIPEGYTVVTRQGGGTRLDLIQGAMILSYSPLRLSGNEDLPFEVTSSDGTGQGILLLNVENDSVLSYVRINNLSVPDRNGWKVPSSLTFYRSAVIIDHCEFSGGNGQGSLLSLVKADGKISDSLFMGSKSDLLTSSFSTIEVVDTQFLGPALSGMSGTGSKIQALETLYDGSLMIGIRGMRSSDIIVENSHFSTARVAGIAEDGSVLTLRNCSINASVIGLAAYKNIAGYGPGTVYAENVLIQNTQIPYLSEKGSSVNFGRAYAPATEFPVFPQIKSITGIHA